MGLAEGLGIALNLGRSFSAPSSFGRCITPYSDLMGNVQTLIPPSITARPFVLSIYASTNPILLLGTIP